ncbi:OmpA family protein [Ramlibacter sp. PS3R-8]|uniref:outer membrane protein OmpA n=1 Tax=Ramlibacter sp. PS3R-8 TaxID=3133437 RepID=UPI0030A31610
MKKLNKVALLCVSTAVLAGCGSMRPVMPTPGGAAEPGRVQAANGGTVIDNWQNGTGQYVWRNGTNELCWRDANWTPATAAVGCDGALVRAAAAPAPAPAPAARPAPPAAAPAAPAARPPAPAPAPQPPAATKVTYAADAFFDFDKSVLKPEGRAKLDDLVGKIQGINLEVIIAVGHTDAVGNDSYNQSLSVRRAEAVKAYLVTKGIEKNRVYTEGKGEKQPVADNKTSEGRAKNRRVEIEVVGTRANR